MPSGRLSRPLWPTTGQQHFGIDGVAVKSRRAAADSCARGGDEVRHVLAVEVEKVGYEPPLPEQELASRQIAQPGVAHVPPGDVVVEMGAGRLPLVAGVGLHVGLVDIEAQHVACQAGAKGAVPDVLQHEGVLLPVGAHGGERFRLADWPAVDVRGRSALFDQVAETLLAGQPGCVLFVFWHALPELGHGNIVHPGALQRVDLVIKGPRRFGMNGDAGLMRQLRQPAIVVRRIEVGDCAADVPQKAVRSLGTLDHPSRQHRHPSPQIVAAPRAELLSETQRPARVARFVAIHVEVLKRLGVEAPRVLQQGLAGMGEVIIKGLRVEEVDLEPSAPGLVHLVREPSSV